MAAVAAGIGQPLAQAVEQEAAVGQLGQGVDEGEVADGLFRRLALGDVDDHPVQPERSVIRVGRDAAALADPAHTLVASAHAVFHLVVDVTRARVLECGHDGGEVFLQDEVAQRHPAGHELVRRRSGQRSDSPADVDHAPRWLDAAAEDDARHVLDQGEERVTTAREVESRGTHPAAMAGVAVHHGEQHQAECAAAVEDQGRLRARVVGFEGRRAAESRHPVAAGDLDLVGDDVARSC